MAVAAPVLVADIGGTNARFALAVPQPDGGVVLTARQSLRTAAFDGPDAAAHAYLAGIDARPLRAAFCVAGPVTDGLFRFTNCPWRLDPVALPRALGLSAFRLLNDFEALALGLPALPAAAVRPLGGPVWPDGSGALGRSGVPVQSDDVQPDDGQSDDRTVMAVIGPGTGLGVGCCLLRPGGPIALPGQGGHIGLVAADPAEAAVIDAARRALPAGADGHVSAEWLLAGPGIPRLHRARLAVAGKPADGRSTPEAIVAGAEVDADADCAATLDLLCGLLGSVAGDLALTLGARGGVFIAGGILPRFADRLAASRFRARFDAKGQMADYVRAIPTGLILSDDIALLGCSAAAPPATSAVWP